MGSMHEGQTLASASLVTNMGQIEDTGVARRRYFVHSSPNQIVTLTIGCPQQADSNSEWSCRFEVQTPERDYSHCAYGEDSLQALQLALRAAAAYMEQMNNGLGGDLRWLDDANQNLGL
jgi:hypothetical protein